MVTVQEVYHTFLAHDDSLLAVPHSGTTVVVFGDTQREGGVVHYLEGPRAGLGLVAGLVVGTGDHGMAAVRQALGGGVGKAGGRADLRGDGLAIQAERGAQRLDARAGCRMGE